jgi:hypothetical protein
MTCSPWTARASLGWLTSLTSLLGLAGCPDTPAGNPRTLWLAPDMMETRVKLVESEPPPF